MGCALFHHRSHAASGSYNLLGFCSAHGYAGLLTFVGYLSLTSTLQVYLEQAPRLVAERFRGLALSAGGVEALAVMLLGACRKMNS